MPRPCRACRWSYGCFVVPKCTATHDDGVTFCWKICAKCEAAFCLNFYLFKRTKVLCISVLYTSNSELLPLKYLLHILSIAYYKYFDRSFVGQSGCYETLSNVGRPGATTVDVEQCRNEVGTMCFKLRSRTKFGSRLMPSPPCSSFQLEQWRAYT